MNEKSDIDRLFFDLMGFYPSKPGTAYEIFSTAILGLTQGLDSEYNQIRKGISGSNYQMDGLLDGKFMVEAKDYTLRGDKVGRADLQKLQGGLTDLPDIASGFFASATDYTRDAKKYAESSVSNPVQKEIVVTNIRPSTDEDLANRIRTISIRVSTFTPAYDEGTFNTIFFEGERERLEQRLRNLGKDSVEGTIANIYNEKGEAVRSIMDLTLAQQPKIDLSDVPDVVEGILEVDGYIKLAGGLFHIKGFKYIIPIKESTETFEIKQDGTPKMMIVSERLGINKLITDSELKAEINRLYESSKSPE